MLKRQIIWEVFGNIKVLREVEMSPNSNVRRFECECLKCGKILNKFMSWITQNKTWCKCTNSWWKVKPNDFRTKEEKSLRLKFDRIKLRCRNPNSFDADKYFFKWIKCEWNNFEEFYRDMWPTYKLGLSLDRIDNDWNYCKENCRWWDRILQGNNRSCNVIIDGLTATNWARRHWFYDIISAVYNFYYKWYRGDELIKRCRKSLEHTKYLRGLVIKDNRTTDKDYHKNYYQNVLKKKRKEKAQKMKELYQSQAQTKD